MNVKIQEKWFVLADNSIKTNFMTIEKEFRDNLYLRNVFSKENSKNRVFNIPIGNEKNTEMHNFDNHVNLKLCTYVINYI